jgi:copper transport protein
VRVDRGRGADGENHSLSAIINYITQVRLRHADRTWPAITAFLACLSALLALLLGTAAPAGAHALAQSSDPAPGAALAQAPKAVSIVFGERPDSKLSSITVVDTSGTAHQQGHAAPVPGHPDSLAVTLGPLTNGVYTVSWRTVSQVDGHLASGSFAFGVGVTPSGAAAAAGVVHLPAASPWSVVTRWLLYTGVMALVGVALLGFLGGSPVAPAKGDSPVGPGPDSVVAPGAGDPAAGRLRWVAGAGWLVALIGVVGLAQQQRHAAGLSINRFWDSSLGNQTLWRLLPLLGAGLAILWLVRRPASRLGLAAIAGMMALLMAADVAASHAAGARSWSWLGVGSQWLHFASAAVWIGGLTALLILLPGVTNERRGLLARRFSTTAAVALGLVVLTGSQRAFTEVRSWHGLFDTSFGRWVVVKIVLLSAIAGLGLINRTRSVPRAARSTGLLQRIGTSEVALAAVVLVATGFLQSLAPPSSSASQPKPPPPLTVSGADFSTTVKVRLDISPGTAGFNRFVLQASDYDTAKPINDGRVSLSFALPSRPDLGQSTLDLASDAAGRSKGIYAAQAANLSVDGTWTINALIQRPSASAQVALTATTRRPPVKIDVSRSPGLPPVYTIHANSSTDVQVYLDPGHPGLNEFHVTLIGPSGSEVPADTLTVSASRDGAPRVPRTVRKLDNVGHFVADLEGAVRGRYQFSIDTTLAGGAQVHADIAIPVS